MSRLLRYALLLLVMSASPAFARVKMDAAADQNPKPEAGKALVVFMRPSCMGGLIASSVYDAPDGDTKFLGVVGCKERVAYQAEPGEHRFMVVAENADFMDAKLEAGKTYYALIRPRPGVWKARFSLLPLHNRADADYSLLGEDFPEWLKDTRLVATGPEAEAWFAESKAGIEEKKAGYLVKWNKMAAVDRAVLVLLPEDGVAP